MVDKVPPTSGASTSQLPEDYPSKAKKGTFTTEPMTFLGVYYDSEDAQKLWTLLLQNLNRQIQHETARAIDTIRKNR